MADDNDKMEEYMFIKDIKIPHEGLLTRHDMWMQRKRDFRSSALLTIYQTVSVHQGDQFCQVSTRAPQDILAGIPMDYKIVTRNTNAFEKQAVNCPFVAYNIGDSKILI